MDSSGNYHGLLRDAQDCEEEDAGMDEIEVPSSSVVAKMNNNEVKMTQTQRRNRRLKYVGFTLFGIGAIVAISLGTLGVVHQISTNKNVAIDDTPTDDIPTEKESPPIEKDAELPHTSTPWLSEVKQLDDPLLNKIPSKFIRASPLFPASTSTALISNTSPQYKALNWTLEDNANERMEYQDTTLLQTWPRIQEQLIQRFVVGTLYFAMHADDTEKWEIDTNWMTSKSVCDWHGITCRDEIDEVDTVFSRGGSSRIPRLESFPGGEIIIEIDLKSNNLHGQIPPEILMFPELKRIQLSENWISGSLPYELFSLSRLEVLDIGDNMLSGIIPASVSGLINIKEIYLSQNQLNGALPGEFGNLTTLREFHCTKCGLGGALPIEMGYLASIKELIMEGNSFTAIPAEMSNLKTLQVLTLSNNPITTGPFPEALFGMESIQTLILGNTGIKAAFPTEISSLKHLQILRLNNNEISGDIPEGVMSEWTQIQRISFENNQITGLPTDMNKMEDLLFFDIFNNKMKGVIPDLPLKVIEFKAFNNEFKSLPENLENLLSMKIFDVAYNDLEGDLPASIGSLGNIRNDCVPTLIRPCVGTSTQSNLEELYLNGNELEGPLPEEFGNLQGLKRLELSNNEFDGNPDAIGNLFNLEILEMDNNNFGSDEHPIPIGFGNLVKLKKLLLNNNNFVEQIPKELGNLVQLEELDLGWNFLSEEIPKQLSKLVKLRKLHLGGNTLEGEIPDIFDEFRDLKELHLNQNNFEDSPGFWGDIPSSLYKSKKLEILRLQGNSFKSEISEKFASLKELKVLILKDNFWDEKVGVPLLICEELTELTKLEIGCDFDGDCDCCTDEC